MNRHANVRGLTLIEVVIASAIFAVVVFIAISMMMTGSTTQETTATANNLTALAQNTMQRCREELQFAKIIDQLDNHTRLRYQIAVDHDGDGDVVDGSGAVEYGYYNESGVQILNAKCELTIEVQSVLRETNGPTLSLGVTESVYGVDLNRDGDLGDVFVVCRLKQQLVDVNGAVDLIAYIDGGLILAPQSGNLTAYDGDVDGGGNDPLFVIRDFSGNEVVNAQISLAARKVEITTFHGGFDATGKVYMLRRNVDQVRLNQKQ